MRPQDSRAVASASPPLNTASASRLLFMSVFLPSADGSSWLLQGALSLGNVSPLSCTPGNSGVSCHERLPEPRQGGCQVVAGSPASGPARSPSSAAWAAADSIGAGSAPEKGARSGRWRLQGGPAAAPLAFRQHGISVGLLLQHEAAIGTKAAMGSAMIVLRIHCAEQGRAVGSGTASSTPERR
jgi:hypothetical protein